MLNSNSVPISRMRINRCPTINCHSMRALDNTLRLVYAKVLNIGLAFDGDYTRIKYRIRGLDQRHHCFKATVFMPFYKDSKECVVKFDCNINQGDGQPDYPFAHNPFNPVVVANYVLAFFGLPVLKDVFGYELFD